MSKKFSPVGCVFKLAVGILFVGLLMGLSLYATSRFLPVSWQMPWVIGIVGCAALVLGVELATVILSPGNSTPFGLLGPKPKDLDLPVLKSRGLLASTHHRARRAFEVSERADEGPGYFIELEDGRVLFLQGQHLYDYGPIEDEEEPESSQERMFPCTEFILHHHKKYRTLLGIECIGTALEPECIVPPFSNDQMKQGLAPEDEDIITDQSYDEIKARLQREE
ncbi:hypothetical protein [Verrucomicrobium sp. BvORR034]|uniref:hypothetical protein n=1 Tax=Verrucomicrobium sp. BvORR034 TaxID=1396418 RepID=UPI00067970AF|nr:hypothetical protein [Verrucomicrobium sp. BvORR034]